MFAIISLLVVVLMSIIITRIASIALTHTGMSRESARFQARSAFTGTGFPTQESEMVVGHPIRRRIVIFLMLLGNAGIVTAVSSLILTFVRQDSGGISLTAKVILLIAGLTLLWAFAMSQWVDRHVSNLTDKILKRYTDLDITDYASLLHLAGDYRLAEIQVRPEDWLDGKSMLEANLKAEGLIVLGIDRSSGQYLGTPKGDTRMHAGDILVVYGRTKDLREIDRREKGLTGDIKHYYARQEQQKVVEKESREDRAETAGRKDAGNAPNP